ncbi:hypothetical protein CON64_05345 [Bacillus pseudomycoides]|nr:hypothetical protein CON64_05345 [Bacillus pseudomycoides]
MKAVRQVVEITYKDEKFIGYLNFDEAEKYLEFLVNPLEKQDELLDWDSLKTFNCTIHNGKVISCVHMTILTLKPYILNYAEVNEFKESNNLFYDPILQINFVDENKKNKAINFGPDKTTITETIENTDADDYHFGPDKTMRTFTTENNDRDEVYFGPETTVTTRAIEYSDIDDFIII